MSKGESRQLLTGWRTFSEVACFSVCAIGGLVFFGWIAGIRPLIHLVPVGVAMNPLTALDFVCAAASLWLLGIHVDGLTPAQRKLGVALAVLVAVTGALKMLDCFTDLPLQIDQFLFGHHARTRDLFNEMAPNTALNFLLAGIALAFIHLKTRDGFHPAQVLMMATGLVALLALIGYSYRVLELYRLGEAIPMALDTAIAFALLSAGFLAARPDAGVMRLITSSTTGGAMVRRSLPMAILIPWLLGALLLLFEKEGYYDSAVSVFAIATIVIFSGLAWWNAKLLYLADLERKVSERRAAAEHNITRVLAESRNLSEAIPRLFQVLSETLGWEWGALWTVDPASNTARCSQAWDSAHAAAFAEVTRRMVLDKGQNLPGRVWACAEQLYVPDLALDNNFTRHDAARASDLRSAFAAPIWAGQEIFGVLELFTRRKEVADEALRAMPPTFATQVGLFIERTRAEEQLRQASRDLQRSNTELGQFAYVASHDLFEPLRMVTSYLQLLREKHAAELPDEAREFIGLALDGAHRMDALIHDLLAYSRVDARGRAFEITDSEQALHAALANLKVAIEESHAVVAHESLPRVLGDNVQLTQLFQNLIGNAIKFHNAAPPQVDIAINRRDHEWLFSVRDNGIGIDPKHFERIFVIFQRLHSRREYAGTGMGLAICKKIIERHGGRIWVESAPGKGSTFFFTLPVMEHRMERESV